MSSSDNARADTKNPFCHKLGRGFMYEGEQFDSFEDFLQKTYGRLGMDIINGKRGEVSFDDDDEAEEGNAVVLEMRKISKKRAFHQLEKQLIDDAPKAHAFLKESISPDMRSRLEDNDAYKDRTKPIELYVAMKKELDLPDVEKAKKRLEEQRKFNELRQASDELLDPFIGRFLAQRKMLNRLNPTRDTTTDGDVLYNALSKETNPIFFQKIWDRWDKEKSERRWKIGREIRSSPPLEWIRMLAVREFDASKVKPKEPVRTPSINFIRGVRGHGRAARRGNFRGRLQTPHGHQMPGRGFGYNGNGGMPGGFSPRRTFNQFRGNVGNFGNSNGRGGGQNGNFRGRGHNGGANFQHGFQSFRLMVQC
jgi:hypothetical protein